MVTTVVKNEKGVISAVRRTEQRPSREPIQHETSLLLKICQTTGTRRPDRLRTAGAAEQGTFAAG
jgi:hypothetical protein